MIPIHTLQNLLPYNCPLPEVAANLSFGAVPTPEDWAAPLLVLRQGSQPFAIEVDRLITEQELVIKPFSKALAAPSYLYGCTIMGDGTLIPVIDSISLLSQLQTSDLVGNAAPATVPVPARISTSPTILVVDDSAGLRQTLTITLEKAGYRVLQARDGREALEQLRQQRQIKLVICDIEMPVMNGFEFLTHRRQDSALLQVPVAMLTSRSGQKHRNLAMHLGASAYFTKPYIEQQFLSDVSQLLSDAVSPLLAIASHS
jgi:chemotaxis family two-component system sensor histidine kinase/response regulator PixL